MSAGGIRARALADRLGGTFHGPDAPVTALAAAEDAAPGRVVVAGDAASLNTALAGAPAAVVVPAGVDVPDGIDCAVIRVSDARYALALASALLDDRPVPHPGVHPTAALAPGVTLGEGVAVAAHAVLEEGVVVGDGSIIGAHCSLGPGARLGRDSRLFPGVRVYDGVSIGDRVRVHSGCVLGADGFGYAAGPGGVRKIHHLGGVVIADDVEIGANTAIDRGTLRPTRIGPRTKIDNLCQIGHNVSVGSDCLIAGMAAVGGSVTIEDGAVLGGSVAVADHVTIHAGARLAGRSAVTKDVPAGQTWAGYPAQPYRRWVRGLYLQGKLETLWQAFKGRDGES